MIEIKNSLGESNVKCIGTDVILLAEAASIVNALYATFEKRMGKRVADAFADLTTQQLANLKEGHSAHIEAEGEGSKTEEKCEPSETDLSASKRKLGAVLDAIEALERLKAIIDKSEKED